MKLSILIPSVFERRQTFLPKCLDMLYEQYNSLDANMQKEVEILVLVDNKKMALGDKRNQMIAIAQGDYVVFVDDDDRIEPDYIERLLKAIDTGADVITFLVSVTINKSDAKLCRYSKNYSCDRNYANRYERLPNHICAVKKSIAEQVPFPSLKYAEDRVYAQLLKPKLNTEHFIDKVLYHYDYNELSTVAQEDLPAVVRKRKLSLPVVADIVMLSHAKNDTLKEMTQKAIDTCIAGANGLNVRVWVVEQQRDVRYRDAELIYHTAPFNYSAFNNLAAEKGCAENIVFANNDLVFRSGWLHALIGANYPVVSPKEPTDVRQRDILTDTKGWENGKHFSPWCFMINRELFNQIGGWDDDIIGWFSDDALIARLKKADVKPQIIVNSVVEHLGSITTKTLGEKERSDFAWAQLELYNRKYNDNKFVNNPNFKAWKQRSQSA